MFHGLYVSLILLLLYELGLLVIYLGISRMRGLTWKETFTGRRFKNEKVL
jgi:hypothetical protein